MALDHTELHRFDGDNLIALYALGFLLAHEIGTDWLFTLCCEARALGYERVPADWILDAAQLDSPLGPHWLPRIRGLIESPEHLKATLQEIVGGPLSEPPQ